VSIVRFSIKTATTVIYTFSLHDALPISIEKLSKFVGGYTKIEMQYRSFDEEQKAMYDERAALVLKSFEWKQNNSEYEIINCAT